MGAGQIGVHGVVVQKLVDQDCKILLEVVIIQCQNMEDFLVLVVHLTIEYVQQIHVQVDRSFILHFNFLTT